MIRLLARSSNTLVIKEFIRWLCHFFFFFMRFFFLARFRQIGGWFLGYLFFFFRCKYSVSLDLRDEIEIEIFSF